jgi:hypothetical protein
VKGIANKAVDCRGLNRELDENLQRIACHGLQGAGAAATAHLHGRLKMNLALIAKEISLMTAEIKASNNRPLVIKRLGHAEDMHSACEAIIDADESDLNTLNRWIEERRNELREAA